MATECSFGGSYYNPEPWANTPCAVTVSVPEGCPVHLVTGAAITTSNVTTSIDSAIVANTTTILGTDLRSFTIPDEFSCDCSPIGIAVEFKQLAIDIPAATAGDTVHVWGTGYDSQIAITPAAPCAAPEWPSDYSVALACDRCPDLDGDGDGDTTAGESDDGDLGGCNAGGESSFEFVALLMLTVMMRSYAQHDRIRAGNRNAGAGTRDGRRP